MADIVIVEVPPLHIMAVETEDAVNADGSLIVTVVLAIQPL